MGVLFDNAQPPKTTPLPNPPPQGGRERNCTRGGGRIKSSPPIALPAILRSALRRKAASPGDCKVHEDGSLRVRFPNAAPGMLEAVIVNTGGGMTGGDRFAIEIEVGEGASLIAGTAAAEKIYRSNGPDADMTVRLDLAKGGAAGLAAAGDYSVRPGAAVAPHRHRSGGRRVAADGGGGGARPRPPWARR